MIRSSKTSLKFSNQAKLSTLSDFVSEYSKVTKEFVDILWPKREEPIPSLLPRDVTSKVQTWLSKRAVQASGKQASGIVRGTIQKHKQRLHVLKELIKEGKLKHARRLQKIIDERKISKPNLKVVNPELDSRFVKLDLEPTTNGFDGWLTLSSVGNKIKLELPFKKTKHVNKMLQRGKLKAGVRLSSKGVTLMFDVEEPTPRTDGKTIGIDIGVRKVISCSNGFQSKEDVHGWNLSKIQQRLSRRKKGSKGFRRAQEHRSNHVNWSINKLNLDGISQVRLEDIKHLRRGRSSSRYLSHFTYAAIFGKLKRACEDSGVQTSKVSPTYTSQRCSGCGWVRKGNRKGDRFGCDACGMTMDSDLNASLNISLKLQPIRKKQRLERVNRKGFYWHAPGQEPIVPGAQGAL